LIYNTIVIFPLMAYQNIELEKFYINHTEKLLMLIPDLRVWIQMSKL